MGGVKGEMGVREQARKKGVGRAANDQDPGLVRARAAPSGAPPPTPPAAPALPGTPRTRSWPSIAEAVPLRQCRG